MICEYGCGNEAKFKLRNGKWCCSESFQKCPKLRQKNSEGVKKAHKEDRMYKFTSEDINKSNEKAINESIKKAFIENSDYSNEFIKPRFINLFLNNEEKCVICGITEWCEKKITFDLDHIDGNNRNNTPDNLRLLCPNCHSQTRTYKGRNINNGLIKINDEKFKNALIESSNIRQALLKLGLTPKGANYERAYKIIDKFKIDM